MASLKDIRRKISSTKNTQQITKAMKMVSAAKLRRAQNAILSSRPYAYKIHSLITRLSEGAGFDHPLMQIKGEPGKRLLLVVLTSDRGLCGGFNNNILKYSERFYKESKDKYENIDFIFIGRRGSEYFKSRNVNIKESMTNLATEIRFELANQMADKIVSQYLEGTYDEVVIVYNEFKSAISQKVVAEALIPIKPLETNIAHDAESPKDAAANYKYEPGPQEILNELLPKHFAVQVYRCLQESIASEHGARMSAMDSATRNAGQMIRKLTLTYNKIRQAAITKELVEIVSGAEALKG